MAKVQHCNLHKNVAINSLCSRKIAILVHCRSQNLFLSIEKTEKTCNYRGWGSVEESQRKFIQGIVNKNQKFFFRLLTFSLTEFA